MPDPIHGIIELVDTANIVVATNAFSAISLETPNQVHTANYKEKPNLVVSNADMTDSAKKKCHPIGIIINQFKRICTIEIKKYNDGFARQPGYHDHIIRIERSLNKIRQYDINNPKNWKFDRSK